MTFWRYSRWACNPQEQVQQAERAKVRAELDADALKTQSKVWFTPVM